MHTLISLVAAVTALASVGYGASRDPSAFVKRYVELHRSGDTDGLLALHTEDSEFVIPGQDPIRGREALRELFAWDDVLESELVMEEVSVDGDTIVVDRIVEKNRWFGLLGIRQVRYRPGTRMVLRDGRILGVYVSGFDEETEKLLGSRFLELMQWLSTDRSEVLGRLLPEGKFRYDGESARLWIQVLEDWNQQRE